MAKKSKVGISNVQRHARDCGICSHPQQDSIEFDFIEWKPPARIARQYRISRNTIYRHARALDLFQKRARNVRTALAHVIERGCETPISAQGLVAAVQAFAKINGQGRWVNRSEYVDLNQLFDRMSEEELETYARDGKLPDWFERTLSGTPVHSPENQKA